MGALAVFPSVSVGSSLVQVTAAGALVFAVGLLIGSVRPSVW